MTLPNFEIEKKYWKQNKLVFGVDEAGRGCLAGPVVAATVAFPVNFQINSFNNDIKINDSKKLTKNERNEAFEFIKSHSLFYSYSIVDNSIIDKYNILQATQIAMNISLFSKPNVQSVIIVDGNYFNNLYDNDFETVIKGDSKSITIAAASIVAKVVRDKFIEDFLHPIYPQYYFNNHKGYATKLHFDVLKKYGKTSFHRDSFLKKFNLKQETEKFELKLF